MFRHISTLAPSPLLYMYKNPEKVSSNCKVVYSGEKNKLNTCSLSLNFWLFWPPFRKNPGSKWYLIWKSLLRNNGCLLGEEHNIIFKAGILLHIMAIFEGLFMLGANICLKKSKPFPSRKKPLPQAKNKNKTTFLISFYFEYFNRIFSYIQYWESKI